MALIGLKNVSKIYKSGEHVLRALDNVDMDIEKGKFGVILGFPLGVLVLKWLTVALASEYEMAITLGPLTYLVSILVTAGVSFVVSLLVAGKNKKIEAPYWTRCVRGSLRSLVNSLTHEFD